jgi:hypothetical protein
MQSIQAITHPMATFRGALYSIALEAQQAAAEIKAD